MEILLNDEEISDIGYRSRGKVSFPRFLFLGERRKEQGDQAVAKSQLKAVAEWIEKEYPPASEQHLAIVEFLNKFSQALINEVE